MITREAFDAWLNQLTDGASLREVADTSDLPVNTISVQRTKDQIPATTILRIARGYGRIPLAELTSFPGYESLSTADLAERDILLLTPMMSVFRELLVRAGSVDSPTIVEHIGHDSFSRWTDHYGPDYTRTDLATMMNMDRTNLSRQITGSNMSFDRCMHLAELLDADARVPLLCCTYLEPVDLFPNGHTAALETVSLATLATEVREFQKYLIQDIRQFEKE